VTSVMQPISR